MPSVTLKGKPYEIKAKIPKVGESAPDFTFVKKDFTEGTLYDDYEGLVKVLIAVPSLDTGVCQAEARRFNEELSKRAGVVGIVISMDLPYAMTRFCTAEGLANIVTASDYRYSDFVGEYNTSIIEGPMKGLSARAVFVVDQKEMIRYAELVPEIGQEPEYEKVLAAVDKLL
ncbi:MAG: thiol peroxidase [Bacteroidetes bacterium]|jgi:thiol peroxidase|nr:MAG: thiol peroxidase [Bacteroidota bacterium]